MRDLPLNALRAFSVVYETGGIRPAARALQVTHSAVSRHLRELEAWLGLPLLRKREGARSLAFTPQGESLGRAGLASLRALEGAVAALRESRRANAVVVTTTLSFAARWLLPRLPGFETEHGWIELSVVADQRLADPVEAGADLAIRMGRGPWPGLFCLPLMDESLFPVVSPDYWTAVGRPWRPEDLVGLRLLHDRDPQASWAAWRAAYPTPDLDVRPGPRFASSDLVLRAAAQGLGVALARGRLAADDLASGALIRPLGDLQVDLPQAYWLVLPEDATRRAAVSTLCDWLGREAVRAAATTIAATEDDVEAG